MISIVIIILVGVVAYYHYTQGFFSSALSAILATFCAIFAVGWHEKLIDMILQGRFADEAHAITLVAIFVLSYSLLRFVFDKLVPGNLRFPAIVDKIGAGAMGLVAGVASAGVAAIAIQTLPFSASILGWSRYEVATKSTPIARERDFQLIDAEFEELTPEKFLDNQPNSLILPVDELLLNIVSLVSSENGSLSAGRPWTATHPDYLQQLFGQRLSHLAAARHCALAGKLSVVDVFTEAQFKQVDQERFVNAQGSGVGTRGKRRVESNEIKALPDTRKPGGNTVLIVVRATLDQDNRELKTSLINFPAAAVRLCLPVVGDPAGRLAANFYPIGTLEPNRVLYVNQPDDMLFAQPNNPVDFVFEVPRSALKADAKSMMMPEGAFFEFKRLARESVGGRIIKPLAGAERLKQSAIVRKTGAPSKEAAEAALTSANAGGGNTTPESTPQPQGNNPNVPLLFSESTVVPNGQLHIGINVGTASAKVKDEIQAWGSFSLEERKFVDLDLAPVQSVQLMSRGANLVNMLGTTPDKRAVIVWTKVREDLPDKWVWAGQVRDFAYADTGNNKHPLAGVIVKLKNANGQDMLNIRYNGIKQGPSDYAPPSEAKDMRPTDVGLIFVVPQGTQLGNVMFKNDVARNLPTGVN